MRKEFNIKKYQEVRGFSDEQIARILAGDTWEKDCIGKTQEEMPRYIISEDDTIEVPETPKEVCELIIKNGSCYGLDSVDCTNCPLNTPDYDCINDVEGAKAWLILNSPLSYQEKGMRWLKENGIEKGDRVKVSKLWEQGERGCKLTPFRFLLDAEGEFIDIDCDGDVKIVIDTGKVIFVPYFALEPVKGLSYKERAEKWVKDNNIKEDTKLVNYRNWEYGEEGCQLTCLSILQGAKGNFIKITSSGNIEIRLNNRTSVCIPYFTLKVVEEPTYKPYPSFEKWMVGIKLKYKGGVVTIVGTPILSYPSFFITAVTRGYYTMNLHLENAFNDCTYEDGTPFGVKE